MKINIIILLNLLITSISCTNNIKTSINISRQQQHDSIIENTKSILKILRTENNTLIDSFFRSNLDFSRADWFVCSYHYLFVNSFHFAAVRNNDSIWKCNTQIMDFGDNNPQKELMTDGSYKMVDCNEIKIHNATENQISELILYSDKFHPKAEILNYHSKFKQFSLVIAYCYNGIFKVFEITEADFEIEYYKNLLKLVGLKIEDMPLRVCP